MKYNKTLISLLTKQNNLSSFTYAHLLMPHAPFKLYDEFSSSKEEKTESYIDYWHFTNRKIEQLLEQLKYKNRYRIIIAGDHGYRYSKELNGSDTYAAFYGFQEGDIEKIKCVQDLGFLINHYLPSFP